MGVADPASPLPDTAPSPLHKPLYLDTAAPLPAGWRRNLSLRLLAVAAAATLAISLWPTAAPVSTCFGTPAHGRLDNGVPIAASGANVSAYSGLGRLLGRTYVHSDIAPAIQAAYAALAQSRPGTHYVYGESGWREGGRMRPHRTHQNGSAVDFMVPVIDAGGRSVPLPTGIGNRLGYGIEFDREARYRDLSIDFDAIADHLLALDAAAAAQGIGIQRVIFDKAYLPRLFAARNGAQVKQRIPFMQGQAWVRHDEHYHVDFRIACQPVAG